MATGRLSLYASLKRRTHFELLPSLAKAVQDIEADVEKKA